MIGSLEPPLDVNDALNETGEVPTVKVVGVEEALTTSAPEIVHSPKV